MTVTTVGHGPDNNHTSTGPVGPGRPAPVEELLDEDLVDVDLVDGGAAGVARFTVVEGEAVARGHEISAVDAVELAAVEVLDAGDRRRVPVVPEWLDRASVREWLGAWVGRLVWLAGFHVSRLPLYGWRLVSTAPWGVRRLGRSVLVWRRDPDFDVAVELMRAGASGNAKEMKDSHTATVRSRTRLMLAGLAAVVAAIVWLATAASGTTQVVVVAVLAVGFGLYGRPDRERPIVERVFHATGQRPPFTEGLMLEGLRTVLGSKGKREIRVLQPPVRTKVGWEAIVTVPGKASAVVEKLEDFAAEVEQPVPCVWLFTDPEQAANWLRIVVTRKSLRQLRMPPWPWLNAGPKDYFHDPVPVGVSPMGTPVVARKAYRSTVYGGMMGSGKSVSMMNSALAACADDRTELYVFDFKGGTDWKPLARFAHVYISGSDPADHETALSVLEELNDRVNRRFRTLRDLPPELATAKTNTVLADRRELDLHPILLVIDETQEPFEFAEDHKRYRDLVTRLIKKGRAVAVTVEGGTQEVKQRTVPFAGVCHFRHCLMVQDHNQVELVLGTGAYAAGHHADKLTADDVGVGYFGSGKEIDVVRSYYVDPDDGTLDELCERYAERRRTRGLLSGMAAGEIDPDTDLEGTLDRVARVWAGDPDRVHLVELVQLLHSDRPGDYPAVTADSVKGDDVARAVNVLSGQLGRHGIAAENMRRPFLSPDARTIVRKGVTWGQITDALDRRDRRPDTDDQDDGDDRWDDTDDDAEAWWDDDTDPADGDTTGSAGGDTDGGREGAWDA